MSNNKNWNKARKDENQEMQDNRAMADDEDEFGEFEGAGHFEPSMAQPLPQALQAGMSAWSTFPDYVPSQHTASSALQPDLLPMQASMHSSQITDSNSSLGEAVSIFDAAGAVAASAMNSNAAAGPLPDLSPQPAPDALMPTCGFHRRLPVPLVGSGQLVLPDVSSRKEVTAPQGRVSLPNFRSGVNGGTSQQGGAIPRTRPGTNGSVDNLELCTSRISGSSPASNLEDQLTTARNLNQRLTNEVEELRQRVTDLEDQLTHCRSLLTSPNRPDSIEAIVQEALQRQRNVVTEEIQAQISQLEWTALGSMLTEDRISLLLRQNNEQQMTVLETSLDTFLGRVQSAIQDGHTGQYSATTPNLDTILEKLTTDQSKRETERCNQILTCLEAIFTTGQQQLRTLLRPTSQSPGLEDTS